jgi:hypothetical protein
VLECLIPAPEPFPTIVRSIIPMYSIRNLANCAQAPLCLCMHLSSTVCSSTLYSAIEHTSVSLPLITCDLKLECTLRQTRAERNSNLLGECPIETIDDGNPMVLRDHYLPTTYTSHTCLRLPDITAAHYEIKPSTIQSLPSFLRLSTENPYDFLNE